MSTLFSRLIAELVATVASLESEQREAISCQVWGHVERLEVEQKTLERVLDRARALVNEDAQELTAEVERELRRVAQMSWAEAVFGGGPLPWPQVLCLLAEWVQQRPGVRSEYEQAYLQVRQEAHQALTREPVMEGRWSDLVGLQASRCRLIDAGRGYRIYAKVLGTWYAARVDGDSRAVREIVWRAEPGEIEILEEG